MKLKDKTCIKRTTAGPPLTLATGTVADY
eukprot:SAG11_NODE_53601_length_103_cov_25.250000_1_plen_28_part_10